MQKQSDPKYTYRCDKCGSTDIAVRGWLNLGLPWDDTDKMGLFLDAEKEDLYCYNCEAQTDITAYPEVDNGPEDREDR